MTIFERAIDFVADGEIIGLGSGRAATAFIGALGQRVAGGLRVRGVPTSHASEEAARRAGVPLASLDDTLPLAVTIDGADEVDPHFNLIKGKGHALVREKIVATASNRLVILVGRDKLVDQLGARGTLPIEVVPFALPLVRAKLAAMGLTGVTFEERGRLFLSDNGNAIIHLSLTPISDPAMLEVVLQGIPGVVGTGLFIGMADVILVGDESNGFALLEERTRNRR